jgi:hypothetical protein
MKTGVRPYNLQEPPDESVAECAAVVVDEPIKQGSAGYQRVARE